MKKPMIGVVPLYDEEKESYWMLPGYMKGIEEAGGIPVMLPLTSDEDSIIQLAQQLDGFVFTGGHDIDPEKYGEVKEEFCGELCVERDQMEELLFAQALDRGKPLFGICRGLQLFNVLLGGTLYQDIPTQHADRGVSHQQKPPFSAPVHDVSIAEDTLLYEILQTHSIQVNSLHHQGIKNLAKQLVPAATAEDGLIEAVVMPDQPFVLAVQWHPEFNYQTDEYSMKLFREFVRVCR